jgi:hypothetical protein
VAQVGRISGPLLEANLLRQGIANNTQPNLTFKNTNADTALLKIDVVNGRIGIDKEAPANELHISQTTRTDFLIGDTGSIANFEIQSSSISTGVGNIFVSAAEEVKVPTLETEQFLISDNYILTTDTNTNIELSPNGSGSLEIINDLTVNGDLSATGNITFDGTITFGNNIDEDTVSFNADIASDINPDQPGTYDLGSSSKRWNTLYTRLFNGELVNTKGITTSGVNINLKVGNIFYVSVNGNDAESGDHPQAPLATLKQALARSDGSTAGPVTIYVYPGEYQEELPLVVPANVSIVGVDSRNCIVTPDTTSQSEDVFHLSDSSTISNITVKDFYYDSINNTGYAFRFAPGAIITNRSPYVQNVTVITHGSVTSSDDPRGFDEGDAGRGAWIDGAELDSASIEASMLFHSSTFICPNTDVINMTNGVRVEWLNSFTYFANRGLYAVDGTTGRTTYDGSTVQYGAELRSIGSANVYGNIGVEADGSDTLMYLIQHNFGYIGSGKYSNNDDGNVNQDNEVIEINGGQVHFVTTDQKGNFRIGDNFLVDFETGNTTLDLTGLEITDYNDIVITSGPNSTTIGPGTLDLASFFIEDNNFTSSSSINVSSNTGTINLLDNTSVTGNVSVSGDFTYGGDITIGNEASDTVEFNVQFDQDLYPAQNLQYNLGSFEKKWLLSHLSKIETADIEMFDNVISTITSNADLELRANGTGNININSLNVTNTFSVSNDTTVDDVNITGETNINGAVVQTGNLDIAGEVTVGNIYVEDNFITATTGNLILEASRNIVIGNSTIIENNFTNNGLTSLQGVLIAPGDITHVGNTTLTGDYLLNGELTVDNVYIEDNFITTDISNADLELRASGTGEILVPNNNVQINNDLTVSSATDVQDLSVTGTITQTGDYNISKPDRVVVIPATFGQEPELFYTPSNGLGSNTFVWLERFDALFGQNRHRIHVVYKGSEVYNSGQNTGDGSVSVGQTFAGSDGYTYRVGTFQGSGGGQFGFSDEDEADLYYSVQRLSFIVELTPETTSSIPQNANFTTDNLTIYGSLTTNSAIQLGDVLLNDNIISTALSNADLELRASGTGTVNLQETVNVTNNLAARNTTTTNATINLNSTSDNANLAEIEINDNYIQSSTFNGNIVLRSDRDVIVTGTNVLFRQDLTVQDTTNLQSTTVTGLITHIGDTIQTGNVVLNGEWTNGNTYIEDNFITTTQLNADLDLRATGNITVPSNNVTFGQDLTVQGAIDLQALDITGQLIHTGAYNQTGDYDIAGELIIDDVYVEDNFITTTTGDLILEAAGVGNINVDRNSVEITNNLDVDGVTSLDNTNINGTLTHTGNRIQSGNYTIAGELTVDNIYVEDNFITTTTGNLTLEASGTGTILADSNNIAIANDLDVDGVTNLDNTNINGTLTHNGNRNQTGNYNIAGELTVDNVYIEDNFITTTTGDLFLGSDQSGDINVDANDVEIAQNLTVSGITNLQETTITGTITQLGNRDQTGNLDIAGEISNGNILIEDNFITTAESNSDLELRASGTGNIIIDSADPVTVNNNLTVQGIFVYNGSLTIDGDVVNSGTTIQDGSLEVGENLSITQSLSVNEYAQFEEILIDDNYITTTSSNADLELRASGTGDIIVDTSVNAKQNITVNNLIEATDVNVNTIIEASVFDTQDIKISTNIISLPTNADLELRASGTGIVLLENDTYISQDINVNSNTDLQNTSITGVLTHNGNRLQTGNYNTTGNLTVSLGATVAAATIIDQVEINTNYISTTQSDADLELRAAGTGKILVSNLYSKQNVSAITLITPEIILNDSLSIEEFEASNNINFYDNVITTTESNSDLELRHAGNGSVFVENVEIFNSTIQTIGDSTYDEKIIFAPSENLIINASSALQIPVGTVENRPFTNPIIFASSNAYDPGEELIDGGGSEDTALETIDAGTLDAVITVGNLGEIRFNTTDNLFEGTSVNNTVTTFGGLYSADRRTTVLAHPTNNTISLTINNTELVTVDSTKLSVHKLEVEDITFSNNQIFTTVSNSNVDLRADGTGELDLGDITLSNNLIKNGGNNLIISNTGFGSTKVGGSNGVVVPYGTTGERPVADPEIGDTRWNTSTQILETWDGNQYLTAAGVAAAISEEEFNNLLLEYTLIFG